jgi:hypothetical protein
VEPASSAVIRAYEDAVVEQLRAGLGEEPPPGWEWRFARNFSVERTGAYPDSSLVVRWNDARDGSRNAWRYPFWYEDSSPLPPDRASGDPTNEVSAIAFTLDEGIRGGTFRFTVAVDPDGTVWRDDERPGAASSTARTGENPQK